MRSALLVGAVGLAACVGDIGGSEELPSPPAEGGVPVQGMRRLSTHEYDRTLRDLLGDHVVNSAALIPNDVPSPFDNDYTTQVPSRALVEAAESLATATVTELLADPARRDGVVGCTPADPVNDPVCLSSFARAFGRRALRRALSDAEVAEYLALGSDFAARDGDFYTGVEVVLRSFLEDIEFLYRVEIGSPVDGHPGVFRLNGYEMATRLSYLLWGTTPDDALLDLAEGGGLDTPGELVPVAQSMIADARARDQIDRFHALWLGYETLQHAPDITQAMRAETRALVERVVFDEKRSWLDLFLSKETFVNDTLATHYGLPAPGSSAGAWMDYSAEGRRGLLSHGSFLSVGHDVGDTSPTARGLHVLHRLTCQDMAPPPPGVDTTIEISDSDCKLELLEAHSQGSCATCHDAFDPIGFGLEQYDVAGRFRTHEDGKPHCQIDGQGALQNVGPFNGPAELGERLVESGYLEACAVEHLYQYALGRRVARDDEPMVTRLAQSFAGSRLFDQLLIDLVSDDAFFFRREEGGN